MKARLSPVGPGLEGGEEECPCRQEPSEAAVQDISVCATSRAGGSLQHCGECWRAVAFAVSDFSCPTGL